MRCTVRQRRCPPARGTCACGHARRAEAELRRVAAATGQAPEFNRDAMRQLQRLGCTPSNTPRPRHVVQREPLSAHEQEVAALVAQALSQQTRRRCAVSEREDGGQHPEPRLRQIRRRIPDPIDPPSRGRGSASSGDWIARLRVRHSRHADRRERCALDPSPGATPAGADPCPWCKTRGSLFWVRSHVQCRACGQVVESCCEGPAGCA